MKRFAGLLVAVFVSALFASSASGATTIGATMSGTPSVIPANCDVETNNVPVSCLVFISSISSDAEKFPGSLFVTASGVITRWRVTVGPGTTTSLVFRPRVIRQTTTYTMAGTGVPRDVPAAGGSFTFEDRLPVQPNDIFAMDSTADGLVGAGPAIVANIGSNANYVQRAPAPADGETISVLGSIGPIPQTKLMINADIEPDVDLDGYGDETQDKCVQRSDVHDACPKPGVTAKAKATSNGFTISVDRAAKAKITIEKVGKGRKVGKKCKKSAKRGKRCNVFTKFAEWNEDLAAGKNKLSYAYKVGGKRLKKGSYRTTITITNSENLKTIQSFKFKVKR